MTSTASTRETAQRIAHAATTIADELTATELSYQVFGRKRTYVQGRPCCALGWVLDRAGCTPALADATGDGTYFTLPGDIEALELLGFGIAMDSQLLAATNGLVITNDRKERGLTSLVLALRAFAAAMEGQS
jgi:GAF domain-containing protein